MIDICIPYHTSILMIDIGIPNDSKYTNISKYTNDSIMIDR